MFIFVKRKCHMKDRLHQFIKSEGLTLSKFAEAMDIGAPNVSHLLSGRNNPGYEFIAKMLTRFPKVNPDWLLLGKGQMYREDNLPPPPDKNSLDNLEQNNDDDNTAGTTTNPPPPAAHRTAHRNQTNDNQLNFASSVVDKPLDTNNRNTPEMIIIFYPDGSFVRYSPK
jgi:transcriptional regulator with XRE-family HTH domain